MGPFKRRSMNHIDLSLFCYCILMLTLNISALTCPTGYTARGSSTCYKFYSPRIISEGQTQVAAQATCQGDGGNLLSLSSDADGRFYRDLMSDNSISEAWIGAYVPTYGEWQYISDESYGFYQGCYSYDSYNTDFSGDITSTSFPSSSVTRATCGTQCGNDSKKYAAVFNGNRCMCADQVTKGTQYVGTSQPCTKECAANSSESCGSHDYNNFADILNVDGEWMIPVGSGQPNNFRGVQSCYAIDQYLGNKLNDHTCHETAYYICRNNVGRLTVSDNRKSWFDARMDCLNSNGDLAKINTAAEWGSLFGQLRTDQLYYIGLTNMIWRWLGQEGSSITYFNWASGKPGNKDNLCAYLDSVTEWLDAPCNSDNFKKYFFCEIIVPPSTTTSTTTTTTTTTPTTTTTTAPATTTTTTTSTTSTPATTTTTAATTTSTSGTTSTPSTTATTPTTTTTATTPTTTSTTTATTPTTTSTTTATTPTTTSTTTATTPTTTSTTTATTPTSTTTTVASTSTATTASTTTTTPTTTTTTTAATTTAAAGGNAGGSAGAATGGTSTLTTTEIILIVVSCVFLILIIILIIVLCYYKKRNNRKNKISGYQDTRNDAHIPYGGSIGDEIYLPASESGSNSSRSNLIRGGVPPKKHRGFEPSQRPASITVDDRY